MNAPHGLHRYPSGAMMSEISGGVLVLLVTLGLGTLLKPGGVFWLLVMAAAAVCIVYLVMVWVRASSRWQVTDSGIEQQAGGLIAALPLSRLTDKSVDWATLTDLRLKYYATRRDQENGWFELTVSGPHGKITLQETLIGFEQILWQAAKTAEKNGVAMNDVTKANLAMFRRSAKPAPHRQTVRGRQTL